MRKLQTVILTGILLLVAFILHFIQLTQLKNTLLLAVTFIAGYSTFKTAWQASMMKTFSIELLVTIAVIGALIIGEYVEAAAVTFLFLFGSYLEARSLEKTRTSLQSLINMTPQVATLIKDGKHSLIAAEEIQESDLIAITAGEKVSIDGEIINGEAFFNEATITGEAVPAHKKIGDKVYTGSIIDQGYVEVRADRVGFDTTFAKIIELIEEAQETKAKTERFLEKFANIYTPSILVLSIILFIITKNIEITLTFLVIACPGALIISAPVSLVTGIGNGAKHGILIKGGEIMEKLSKAEYVIFDKTGTLTEGKPSISEIKYYEIKKEQLLQIAATVERQSEHHLGRAIVDYALEQNIEFLPKVDHFETIKGQGVKAQLDKKEIFIGNESLLEKEGIHIPKNIKTDLNHLEKDGKTVIYIAINRVVKGLIAISDKIKHESKQAISWLHSIGVKQTFMLTGDNEYVAHIVASELEIDQVYANLLPEEKVAIVKSLQDQGHSVIMVGDGINDAPSLALADVGIAMGNAGTDIAMETADLVLMNDDLLNIPYSMKLAKHTVKNMKQNMFIAVGTVLLLLLGVLFEKVFLASGMLIHELSVLIVIANALTIMHFKKEKQLNESIIKLAPIADY